MVCDAQVNFEKYGKINKELIKGINLLATCTSNPKWTKYWGENGGKIDFFVNKDNIRTHKIFGEYFEDKVHYTIPAASNVANSMYVIASIVMRWSV